MAEKLPKFKYHPDPIKTENIVKSDKSCVCCKKSRDYIYVASVYTTQDIEKEICPWCISDGSAAEKFGATFTDDYPLFQAKLSDEIITEVAERTPGFISWQQENWLSHCNDACEFHGDLEIFEAKNLTEKEVQTLCVESEMEVEDIKEILKYYEKGGNPAIYKFVCRHCREIRLYTDFT